jgi:adenosine/AMP kinase
MDHAVAREIEHPLDRGSGLDVGGGGLHERAALHERREAADDVGREVTLGVGDEAAQPLRGEVVHGRGQAVRQRPRSRLEQDPAPAPAQRHGPKLGVVEVLDDRLGDLAAWEDARARARVLQRRVQLGHAIDELGDPDVVVVADVRGRADECHTVTIGLTPHRDAVGEVERAIVDPGEDVAMQVDHITSEGGDVELTVVPIEKPEDLNVIVGQAHFIKTVEDLHEALAGTSPHLRFGVAFNEASGPRLVRRSGNDDELVELATRNALAIAAGHVFVVFVREGFPVNVLNQVKQVPEVCTIHCATANAVGVLVAETESGRGVVGVVDGAPPLGVESDGDVTARKALLRTIGYKL